MRWKKNVILHRMTFPYFCSNTMKNCLFLLLACLAATHSFYLPGSVPVQYKEGERLSLKVNSLTSVRTHLPYPFYSLQFCRPDRIVDQVENLGEILVGDRIQSSRFEVIENRALLFYCSFQLLKPTQIPIHTNHTDCRSTECVLPSALYHNAYTS